MPRSLVSVVQGVAGELALLASAASALQERMGPAPLEEEGIVALQSLDHLTQSLGCLAEFLTVLSDELPRQCQPDLGRALRSVWLSEVACRLGQAVPDRASAVRGDCEFFGTAD